MSLVATDVIVLHVQDYLESSRIVRLATRELGVQSALARGSRRPKSRFGHSLDLFASGVAQFTVRPGRDLSNLTGFDLTRSRMAIAADLDRFAAASAIAELALRFSFADPNDGAFDVLTDSFDAIAGASAGSATDAGLAAAWQYITSLGFGPSIDSCCTCQSALAAGDQASFSHEAGGVLCARCAVGVVAGRSLPASARDAIRTWLDGRPAALAGEAERRAHLRLLREFLQHHLTDGREMLARDGWEASQRRTA